MWGLLRLAPITINESTEQVDQPVLGMQGTQTPHNLGNYQGRRKSYGVWVRSHITLSNPQHVLAGPLLMFGSVMSTYDMQFVILFPVYLRPRAVWTMEVPINQVYEYKIQCKPTAFSLIATAHPPS